MIPKKPLRRALCRIGMRGTVDSTLSRGSVLLPLIGIVESILMSTNILLEQNRSNLLKPFSLVRLGRAADNGSSSSLANAKTHQC